MDKGAHYHRCDFQVHTPRDIHWVGKKFGLKTIEITSLTEECAEQIKEDRKHFAKEYLQKAREAGLNSIAITDHHDVVFVKLIRNVAQSENEQFKLKREYEKCITVFPGIELTLSNPASQCIIIFDSDFPDDSLDSLINYFGIIPSHEFDENTTSTERISQDHINDLLQLHKKLNELTYSKGRYIVFPNVANGGKHSILRQGFHEHYRKMPCVGGYVDKDISIESGYQNKLNGDDVNYGNKSIAVLSTSDNRYEDGRLFGKHTTWIKWAVPTAEALRQACLAKESRLSQASPELPQIHITKIDVTNSRFLGSFSLEFSQQYTALIGGRGTGKSTILEYLRWGLCDQTAINFAPEEQSDIEKRSRALIEKTLLPFDGEVRVTFSLNGIIHIVKRNSVSKEVVLKIGSGEFEKVKEEEIRRILPVQAYSQKQLSSVGIRTEELKRFIQLPISNQLNSLKFEISDNSKRTRSNYNNFVRKKELQSELDQFTLEIKSLNNQVENLRKHLTGISEVDQQTIAKKQKFDNEQGLIKKLQSEIATISLKISDLNTSLHRYPEPFPGDVVLENQELIRSIEEAGERKFQEVKTIANQLQNTLSSENMEELNEFILQWEKIQKDFEIEYETAKAKASVNQAQLIEMRRIETRLQELANALNERNMILKELGNPETEFNQLREEWLQLHQRKIDLLNEQAQKFSTLSKGLIKAEITKSIDIRQIRNQIISAFQGTRINESKVQSLCDYILTSENPLNRWKEILNELKSLAELKISQDKNIAMPETPNLTGCDYNDGNRTRIAEVLTPENWLSIATIEIEFNPEFKYTTNSQLGDVILFSEASAGQQATALLTVLLNQPGTPLIIDQPEDDIDNRAIEDIIKNIWDAKKKRQLIFTSHNANLVVNGDAELVICCDYRESASQTRGMIKSEGAIDFKAIRDEITSVMEGGEKAFRLRKDKYGF